jgi:hypothetical protein
VDAFSDNHVLVEVKEKVLSDWAHLCVSNLESDAEQCAINKNPIQKVAVVLSGDFGAVFIDTIGSWRSRAKKVAEEVLQERL